jgi:hypothetical protein
MQPYRSYASWSATQHFIILHQVNKLWIIFNFEISQCLICTFKYYFRKISENQTWNSANFTKNLKHFKKFCEKRDIFDYLITSPLPLVIKRNHLKTPSPLADYVIYERPLIFGCKTMNRSPSLKIGSSKSFIGSENSVLCAIKNAPADSLIVKTMSTSFISIVCTKINEWICQAISSRLS